MVKSNHWSTQLQNEHRSSRGGQRSIRWKSKKRKANQRIANQEFARCNPEAENCNQRKNMKQEEKRIKKIKNWNQIWIQLIIFQFIFPLLHEYTFFVTQVKRNPTLCTTLYKHPCKLSKQKKSWQKYSGAEKKIFWSGAGKKKDVQYPRFPCSPLPKY